MKKLIRNNHADMNMVLNAVIVAIALAVSILVVLNISGIDVTDTQDRIRENFGYEEWKGVAGDEAANASHAAWNLTQPVTNASDNINANIETFYTIAPIVLVVMSAVGILSYVLLLRRT